MLARRYTVAALLLALGVLMSGCASLRDAEPFTLSIIYERPEREGGPIRPTPLTFTADWAYGELQVLNKDSREHGFAIRELAVFERIPKGLQRTVRFDEARNGQTYTFECQLHDGEFFGTMKVVYKSADERE